MAVASIFVIFGIASLVCAIATIVSAAGLPDAAFKAANTNKVLWIVLPIVGIFVCGLVSIGAAVMWFNGVKQKVQAAAV